MIAVIAETVGQLYRFVRVSLNSSLHTIFVSIWPIYFDPLVPQNLIGYRFISNTGTYFCGLHIFCVTILQYKVKYKIRYTIMSMAIEVSPITVGIICASVFQALFLHLV